MADFKTLNGYAVKDNQARTDIANILEVQNGMQNKISNLSNPNLLINSDFRSPINQRGQTTYQGSANSTVYTIDRWRLPTNANRYLNVLDGCVELQNGSSNGGYMIYQYLETPLEGTFTATIDVESINGECYFGFRSSEDATIYETLLAVGINTVTFTVQSLLYVRFKLNQSATAKIKWIKLEQGSISTPFTPRSYGEELEICKRYYQKSEELEYFGPLISMDSTTLRCQTRFTGFRTAPTVKVPSGTTFAILNAGNASTSKDTTLSSATMSATGEFKATVASGINVGLMCIARIHKPIEFDAEIY